MLRRYLVGVALLVLALGGCTNGSYLLVTIDSNTPLEITALDVTIENSGSTAKATLDKSFHLPPAQDFVIELPSSRSGIFKVDFAARNGAMVIARGAALLTVTGAGTTSFTVFLSPTTEMPADMAPPDLVATDGAPADLTASGDLVAVANDLMGADLTTGSPDLVVVPDLLAPPDLQDADLAIVPDLAAPDLVVLPDLEVLPDLVVVPDLAEEDLVPPDDLTAAVFATSPAADVTVAADWVVFGELDETTGSGAGLDLVYVDADGVHWLAGTGSATFGSTPTAVAGMTATSPSGFARVVAADFTGDDHVDLVATRQSGDEKIYRALATSAGVFDPEMAAIAVGPAPRLIALGDANGDTKRDVFVGLAGADPNQLYWLRGVGDGTFVATAFGTGVDPVALAAGDLNGDGNDDVAVACSGTSGDNMRKPGVYVQLTDATGLSLTRKILSAPSDAVPTDVALGALIGGGAGVDVVAACPSCGELLVFANDGLGNFSPPIPVGTGTAQPPSLVAAGDLDGDGDIDLVAGSASTTAGAGGIAILLNNGDDTFADTLPVRDFVNEAVRQIVLVDLTGSARPEIVVVTETAIHVLINGSHF